MIRPNLLLLAAVALVASGCDQGAPELVSEINAAREGCTEEMLKQSDEQCVQMFERYAEMGEDALETYIGGMKAFDEALRRRGGIQFDTVGLGRVFSEPIVGAGDETDAVSSEAERALPYVGSAPSWRTEGDRSLEREPEVYRPPAETDFRRDESVRYEDDPAARDPRDRPAATGNQPRRAPLPPRRGTILPPEDRLRRPWIDDSEPDGAYFERRDPADDRRSRERVDPYAEDVTSAPYPRE